MNIVFVAPFAFSPKATVSARMYPIATALRRRGHRITLLMPPYDNLADSGKVWEYEGVQMENVRSRHASPTRQYWDMAQQLAERVRAIKPDVACFQAHRCGRFGHADGAWRCAGGAGQR
jgi:hypothetical protein